MVELDKRQVEVRLKQAEGRVQRKNECPACKEVRVFWSVHGLRAKGISACPQTLNPQPYTEL